MRSLETLAALIAARVPQDGVTESGLDRLSLIRSSAPTEPIHTLYPPSFCLVAQGRKEVTLAGRRLAYDPASFLIVGIDLPALGAVVSASAEQPYLSLRLEFDRGLLAEVLAARAPEEVAPDIAVAATSPASPDLVDAVARLLALLDEPEEATHLAPLVEREILHRLFAGPQGGLLRQIVGGQGRLGRIDRAVRFIRSSYQGAFSVEELAALAGMSPSAFHAHFRAVTTMTPLQFRNRIRLQEARRLMIMEGLSAAQAGFAVGYESPSQFSRDYARVHRAPPRQDVERLRRHHGYLARDRAAWGS